MYMTVSYEFLNMEELYGELEELRDIASEMRLDGVSVYHYDEDRHADLEALDSEIGLDSVRFEVAVSEEGFAEYARELAHDIGAVDLDAGWPTNRIDWEAAAEDLKMDYHEFEFDGKTWLIRA